MREFLEVVLSEETLSVEAETARLRLLSRLATSNSPPPAYYITMNKSDSQSQPDGIWGGEGSYEVMQGPPPVYSNTMPDVLSSSKRISKADLRSIHTSTNGLNKSSDCLSRRSVVTVQSGVLWRKKRRRPTFLPWSRITEYWAALTQSTLHLYPADRRSKPALQIDLAGYQARSSINQIKPTMYGFEMYSPGRKTYQFFANTEEEVSSWVKAVCEGCSEARGLPNLPENQRTNSDGTLCSNELQDHTEGPYEHYDVPDSRLRPVKSPVPSHYHSISYSRNMSPTQEHVYKNVDEFNNADNTYYNIVTSTREIRTEQIYQTIPENKCDVSRETTPRCISPVRSSPETSRTDSPVSVSSREPTPAAETIERNDVDSMTLNKRSSQRMSGGRVQQIVKSLEAHDIKDFEQVEVGRIDLHRLSR